MKRWLAALAFVVSLPAAAADEPGAGGYDPSRITPEMKAVTETIAQAVEGLAPRGFARKGPVERYTEASLYEKINGRSELFHSYDVTGMTFATYSAAGDPSRFIDVFLYDMTTPLGAYGIYSVERSADATAVAVGDGGHRAGADWFFRKGRYYATILTSGPDAEIQKAAAGLAETLAKRLKGEAARIWGLAVLPGKNRVDDSVQYLMVDAMGLDFLSNVFAARYRDGQTEYTGFVSRCRSEAHAGEVLEKYRAYFKEFGELAEPATIGGTPVMFADLGGGEFEGACRVRDHVVGVTGVKGRDAAVKAMTSLLGGVTIPK